VAGGAASTDWVTVCTVLFGVVPRAGVVELGVGVIEGTVGVVDDTEVEVRELVEGTEELEELEELEEVVEVEAEGLVLVVETGLGGNGRTRVISPGFMTPETSGPRICLLI